MSDLYFPRSLKPVVSKGYSMTRRNNVWSVDLAGGGVRQGRDTYYDVFPISVTLITSALGRQAFLSFLEKVDGGASSFWMAHDFGMGIEDYQVTITSTIAESTEDGINWTITFTATAEKSPFQDLENQCLINNLPDLYGCYGDCLGGFLKAYGIYATTFPRVWEPNVIASFDFNSRQFNGISFSRASTGTYIYGGVLKTAAINAPRYEDIGLLIEDTSSNITSPSEGWVATSGATGANAYSHTAPDSAGWITVSGGTDTGRVEGSYRDFATGTAVRNKTATFSLDVKKIAGYKFRIVAYKGGTGGDSLGTTVGDFVDGQAFPSASVWAIQDMGSWLRIELRRGFGSGTSIFRLYPFGNTITAAGVLTYRRCQVELQAIASSYIKTPPANTPRAADILTLTTSGTPKRVYREYTPLGSTTPITETVPYTGVLCPPGNVRVIKVLND